MLNFTGKIKVYLAVGATDLRQGFSGLYGATENILKEDPKSGSLFVFSNQRHNRIKVLYYDGTGLWIMTKRLEQGTFSWPKGVDDQEGKLTLTPEALGLLLDGVDMRSGKMRPWYQR